MEKINFENLPSTNTPLNADTLNDMQDGIEKSANYIGSTQPSTGEKVWFKTGATKEILVKNSNNVFETYYSQNYHTYSTSEVQIGTWIDGKPLYRKVISYNPSQTIGALGQLTDIDIAHNVSNLKMGWVSNAFTSDGYQIPAFTGKADVEKGTNVYRVTEYYIQYKLINDTWGATRTWYFILEYTKTTD